jgi:hypothetical protein
VQRVWPSPQKKEPATQHGDAASRGRANRSLGSGSAELQVYLSSYATQRTDYCWRRMKVRRRRPGGDLRLGHSLSNRLKGQIEE